MKLARDGPAASSSRSVNEGFSGGEKKRNEILQMAMLEPRLAILDETDSGLDIDALRDRRRRASTPAQPRRVVLVITHYQRLLDYIVPDRVHVMVDGPHRPLRRPELALELEERGYDRRRHEARVEPRTARGASRDAGVPPGRAAGAPPWLTAARYRSPARGRARVPDPQARGLALRPPREAVRDPVRPFALRQSPCVGDSRAGDPMLAELLAVVPDLGGDRGSCSSTDGRRSAISRSAGSRWACTSATWATAVLA